MQCLIALSEMETDKMMYILFEEATARNSSHPDMLSKPLAEMQVILHAILRDVKHHIIGSFGISKLQSELTKSVTNCSRSPLCHFATLRIFPKVKLHKISQKEISLLCKKSMVLQVIKQVDGSCLLFDIEGRNYLYHSCFATCLIDIEMYKGT